MLAAARLQGRDPISILVSLLTSPTPKLADLLLPGWVRESGARCPNPQRWPAPPVPRSGPGGEPSEGARRRTTHQFRVVVYVRTATTTEKVLDVTGDAFHAPIGHFEGDVVAAHHSSGGDPGILEMLADAVADNPRGEAR